MALFKISKGSTSNINTTIPNAVEGYCYFNLYDNKFYIDTQTGTLTGTNQTGKRVALNAVNSDYAKKLQTYYYNSTENTYGTSYPLYAQWDSTGKICDLKVDNYTTRTNLATLATAADKWSTPRSITLTGDTTGSVQIDGSSNVTMSTTTIKETGYGTCSTAAATIAKVVTLANYTLVTGGIVAVKFTYAVPANATMNINSKGAKKIFYKGTAITDGIICAGEVATFIYDGTQYHLLGVDRNRFFTSLVPMGIAVPANADLNTLTYLKVGNYYCSSNATTATLSNCPTVTANSDGTKSGVAFMMTVSSPLSQTVDDESGTWRYRFRTLQAYNGPAYTQYCYSNGTAGNWIYGPWQKIIRSTDIDGAISTVADSNLTASRALVSNSSGKIAVSAVTSTELGYLDGVTSNVQTQLNGKLNLQAGLRLDSPGTSIPSNSDLNSYTTPGNYYSASSSVTGTLTNSPTTGAGFRLIVINGYNSDRTHQIAICNNDVIKTRFRKESTWTDWDKILTQSDETESFVLKAGDTMTGNLVVAKESGSPLLQAHRTDTGAKIALMVGSSATNKGIWDQNLNNNAGGWLCYTNGTDAYFATNSNYGNVYLGSTQVYVTSSSVLMGAAWNDYAEYRISDCQEPGRVICENGDDTLSLATERLQPAGSVISDTFGFAIGETETAKTPIAVSGRVLVYPYEDRYSYNPGDAVCAAPGGTVSKMTREEIITYPERIIGTVSAIPEYETWGEGNVPVNGRIWIKVK